MSALCVQVRDAEGILERILMTTRRRGFQLHGCEVQRSNIANIYDITLHVESDRPLSFLANQLQKLVDVITVNESREERHVKRA